MKSHALLLPLLVVTATLYGASAFGHARLRAGGSLQARNNFANKTGPCGSARTLTPTFLIAGSQLTVQWEEFIEHPGYYRIAFSPANDQGFDQNILMNNIPDLPGATGTNPIQYQRNITVPNTPCNFCTIQVIQVMTENPNAPELYYSCADVVILPQGSTLPTPNPSPTPAGGLPNPNPTPTSAPTTTPGPSGDCK